MTYPPPYGSEDPSNLYFFADGYRRETLVTCEHCRTTSELVYRDGKLLCSWHVLDPAPMLGG